ncbi:myo-inosose-2 dehydratase [Anoxynatronum sibiricum]|uniref:Inosose dehydratase n=1 Tax=Anoxynatronum sibiricum TaxID=210623 RepID=A0ABU9VXR1_9CLOT
MYPFKNVKLAVAPIAWTNDDMPELGAEYTFENCIDEMALAGYVGSEVGNKYPKEPAVLKAALDERGLQICNAWFSSFLTTKPLEETVEAFIKQRDFLHALGAKRIGVAEQGHSIQGLMDVPVIDQKPVFSEEEWHRLTTGLNRLGELAAEKDMKVVYHHHMGTGVQTTAEIDRLMEQTDPNKVFLLYDTGHLVFSGEDHVMILKKYINRIFHVHLKDVRQEVMETVKQEKLSFLQGVRQGVFTVPGDGMIDFDPVFKVLSDHGYEGWFVVEAEQDPALANPLEYAKMARSFIKEKTGL